jgi:hypothetical protein
MFPNDPISDIIRQQQAGIGSLMPPEQPMQPPQMQMPPG